MFPWKYFIWGCHSHHKLFLWKFIIWDCHIITNGFPENTLSETVIFSQIVSLKIYYLRPSYLPQTFSLKIHYLRLNSHKRFPCKYIICDRHILTNGFPENIPWKFIIWDCHIITNGFPENTLSETVIFSEIVFPENILSEVVILTTNIFPENTLSEAEFSQTVSLQIHYLWPSNSHKWFPWKYIIWDRYIHHKCFPWRYIIWDRHILRNCFPENILSEAVILTTNIFTENTLSEAEFSQTVSLQIHYLWPSNSHKRFP